MADATDLKIDGPRAEFGENNATLGASQEKAAVSLEGPQSGTRIGGLNNAFNVSAGFTPQWSVAELQQNDPEGGTVPFITPKTNLLQRADITGMTLSDPDTRGVQAQSGIGELCAGVGNTVKQLGAELSEQMPAMQAHMLQQQPQMKPGLFG